MKGSMFGKWIYVVCALAGCISGAWIFHATETKQNIITKDNTLLQKQEDSVFFDAPKSLPEVLLSDVVTLDPMENDAETSIQPQEKMIPEPSDMPDDIKEPVQPKKAEQTEALPTVPTKPVEKAGEEPAADEAVINVFPNVMPSLASQWMLNQSGNITISDGGTEEIADIITEENIKQQGVVEVITYPAEIFGQVPVINRSDAYVSYFEFCYDLVSMMEQKVKQRGINMTALMTKFAVKALFCGVDIEKLDINAPIPRRQAALVLWLAADLLGENGSETSAKSVEQYVTDMTGCSGSEKKAVVYLYEQGIIAGDNRKERKFYPHEKLKTETGTSWLSGVKQHWK